MKGERKGEGVVNCRSGVDERGMKCIFEGEGRIRRLLRSKSWQKIAVCSVLVVALDCGFLSVTTKD